MRNYIITGIVLLLSGWMSAAELTVPGQYTTLGDALDAATNGDTITLAAGNYEGSGFTDLVIDGLGVTIRGALPVADEIITVQIDCDGSNQSLTRAFTIKNGAEVNIIGIDIINGYHTAGGAILITSGQLIINDCSISNCNSESTGGAISISGVDAELEIENCVFQTNSSLSSGGAISIDGDIAVSITNTSFTDNTSAMDGGAVFLGNNSNLSKIETCVFTGNFTKDFGGALAVDSVILFELTNSLIAGNRAESFGGGVYISNSASTNNITADNKIINCTISENMSSVSSGGMRIFNSEVLIANSIIYGNILDTTTAEYIEIAVTGDSSIVQMAHCINRGFDEFFIDDSEYEPVYNFVEVGSLLENLGGNLDVDPAFTDTGSWEDFSWTQGNYLPLAGSFCYNSGLNDYLTDSMLYDLAGEERLVADFVDIGCYEMEFVNGGDITATLSTTFRYPDEIIPGDKGKCVLLISNIGNEDISGSMAIKLYYSTDRYIDDNDTLLTESRRDLRVKYLVAKPRSTKYTLSYTIPGDIPAGDYYLLAHLDSNNSIAEADESINSNVIVGSPQSVYWKFGTFGNRRNASLTITDASNILNRYTLKYGSGELSANRSDINIISESESCTLTITPRTRGAIPELGNIDCTGSFSLNAKKCNLVGDVNVSGIMPKLTIGDILYSISPVVVTVSGSTDNTRMAMSMQAANVNDLNLFSEGFPIKSIKVNNWINNSGARPQINSTWIKSISSKGDFEADLTLTGENASKEVALTSASIKGNINNCKWLINGHAKKVSAIAISGFDLFVGTKDGITEPTGNETNDILGQYTLALSLSDSEHCMTASTIIAWEISKLSFKRGSVADSDTYIEYFYSRRPVVAPDNANLITVTPADGQEGETPVMVWNEEYFNYWDFF